MISSSVCASSLAYQDMHLGDEHGHILGDVPACRATASRRSPIFGVTQDAPQKTCGRAISMGCFLHMRSVVDELSELNTG